MPSNQLVLASGNAGKVQELQAMLQAAAMPVTVHSQRDFEVSDAIEDGLSFVENALIKARHAARSTSLPALADDSGLCVPLLQGAPGIHSARYSGQHGDDAANNHTLLQALLPYRQRPIAGQFVCVLVAVRHADDPLPLIAQGIWQGWILPQPQGTQGFGYDPLFQPAGMSCSSAELAPAIKNTISHRALAMQSLIQQMQQQHWLG